MKIHPEKNYTTEKILCVLALLAVLSGPHSLGAQDIDLDALKVEENIRWGVESFHSGQYNNAIQSFEKALSGKPDNRRARIWLGKAFYQSGFEEQALHEWSYLVRKGWASSLVNNWIDFITYRRSLGKELPQEDRYVVSSQIIAGGESYYPFKRPTSLKAASDGSYYVVAFASNEVLRIDPNQVVIQILNGGIEGFNHPFDIVEIEGKFLFISEYSGNRIAKCTISGQRLLTFGDRGTGPGALLGPQYMAADEYGYLYVTDFGNRRVNKYDFDGNFILSFGARTSDFPGFSAPTGIAVSGDRVFISDRWKKVIYVFDRSGNFLTSIGSESLNGPESLTFMGNQLLLIADTDRLLVYDLEKETAGVIGDIAPRAARIMGVTVDTIGNILAADFDLNRIFYLSQITGLYTGYFAKIERVDARNFPEVIAEVSVTGKKGNPIVGLKQENFRITESSRPVKDLQLFQNTGDYSPLSIVLLVEKSLQTRKALDSVVQAAERIFNLYQKRAQIKLVSAGEAPTVGSEYGETRLRLLEAVRKADFSESWRFDQGLRMAAAELLPARGKKAIIFISGGSLGRDPYRTYSLMELTQFLKNNYITFNTVLMERRQADLDLNYICSNTGGQIAYFYNPEGIGDLARTIDRFVSPVYILRYLSPSYSEFGRMYIPIEAEITLQAKNGYDESGYYAPLQF